MEDDIDHSWAAVRVGEETGLPAALHEGGEIPEDMQKKHGFKPLGPADGPVKRAIFAGNATRIYGLKPRLAQHGITTDKIAAMKAEYLAAGGARTNARYGYVARSSRA